MNCDCAFFIFNTVFHNRVELLELLCNTFAGTVDLHAVHSIGHFSTIEQDLLQIHVCIIHVAMELQMARVTSKMARLLSFVCSSVIIALPDFIRDYNKALDSVESCAINTISM